MSATREYLTKLSMEMGYEGEVTDEVVAQATRQLTRASTANTHDIAIDTKTGDKYEVTNAYYDGWVDINKQGAVERIRLGEGYILEKLLDALA